MTRLLLPLAAAVALFSFVATAATNPAALRRRIEDTFYVPNPLPPLSAATNGAFQPEPGILADRITYHTEFGMSVPAIVYHPARPEPHLHPALIIVNGHGGDKYSWYSYYAGILYARAGAVVLTYDPAGEGERNSQHRSGTRAHDRFLPPDEMAQRLAGLMITDLMQAVSYLRSRPDVDPSRIAAAGYSMGSFVVSLTCAVDTRLHACVAVGGGDLDGPNGYWDSSDKPMCQAIPYRSLSFLGDRPAQIFALNALRGPFLIYNGVEDEVVDIPHHGPSFFADLRNRTIRLNGSPTNVFDFAFSPTGSHRPWFLTKPVALWLNRQLHFPLWTTAAINAMPETHISEWAAQNHVPIDRLYATEPREGGTLALGAGIPALTRDQLNVLPESVWSTQLSNFSYDSWTYHARSVHVDNFTGRPRMIVISDIGNEPDDQMSLTRLLLYSNQLDIEALIAVTSTWQRTTTHAETMRTLIRAYARVRPNLLLHAQGWPIADQLDNLVFTGQPAYGLAATGLDKMSEGAQAILDAAARPDPRPIWITIWGGANTLAQALLHARATLTRDQLAVLISKLRVYSISDQDDAGPWIRREFPDLFYIVQPTTPTSGEYYYATWTGISGDIYYRNGAGADGATVTNEWLDTNIRSKGPLGKLYPRFLFVMEGDTPSYLNLLDNGLNAYRRPDWGGWGGRYIFRQPYGETHPIWTQGGDLFSRVTSQDTVPGVDGQLHTSDQATIWRWRTAYQNDFAARMSWTISDFAHANHNPIVVVNGDATNAPISLDATVGQPVPLDASSTHDPDANQHLRYHWFLYSEAGSTEASLAALTIANAASPTPRVIPTATCRPEWLPLRQSCPPTGAAHLILAVTDDGAPPLTSYRRILLTVHSQPHPASIE